MVWYRYSSLITVLALAGCAAVEQVGDATEEGAAVGKPVFYSEAEGLDTDRFQSRRRSAEFAALDQKPRLLASANQPMNSRFTAGQSKVLLPAAGGGEIAIESGQCMVYAQIKPRPFERVIEVTIKDSSNKISVTPAQLKRGYRQVETREGVVTYRIEPPRFKKVIEQVMVKPEVQKVEVLPAVYQKKTERIKVKDSRTVFEPCQVAGSRYSKGGVVAFCAREIPAKYEMVQVEQLVEGERASTVMVPAEYQAVTRWVVSQPARAVAVLEGAEVQHLLVDDLVRDAVVDEYQIASQVKVLSVTAYEGASQVVVRRAVCDANMTHELIIAVQKKLVEAGYSLGGIDGRLGKRTISALADYQLQHRLAIGALTYEALEAMGVK